MAVFTFSEPRPVFSDDWVRTNFVSRAFNAIIDARMAKAERDVQAHLATLEPKTRTKFDLDAAVVGKGGIYAWPY